MPNDTLAPIDCDIHVSLPATEALFPYLAEQWIQYIRTSAFKGVGDTSYPRGAPTSARPETVPPGGGPPGSDLALVRQQTLDAWSARLGVLNCDYGVQALHNPDLAAAMASALNDWLIAAWLEPEPRFRASLVAPRAVEDAVREIERVGGHPGFVQVFLPVRSQHPYGSRLFRPMWEAISRHELVAGMHFGGAPGNPPTPSGWPSYYFEEYSGMAQVFASQVVSLITEGVFDRWPNLRVTLLEGGFTWLPAHMWRFDKEWRNLRPTVPWVKRPPSAYTSSDWSERSIELARLLGRQLVPRTDLLFAHPFARRGQFPARPFRETLRTHSGEHFECRVELLTGVEAALRAAQPFAVAQPRACGVHCAVRTLEPVDRLNEKTFSVVVVGEERSRTRHRAQSPVRSADACSFLEQR